MTAVGFEPTRIAPPELESGALDRSAKLSSVTVVCTVLVEQCVIITQKNNKSNTPGRTRTCNLWIRSPTRYPLRHEGPLVILDGGEAECEKAKLVELNGFLLK